MNLTVTDLKRIHQQIRSGCVFPRVLSAEWDMPHHEALRLINEHQTRLSVAKHHQVAAPPHQRSINRKKK